MRIEYWIGQHATKAAKYKRLKWKGAYLAELDKILQWLGSRAMTWG
jgi:hypothetical protein